MMNDIVESAVSIIVSRILGNAHRLLDLINESVIDRSQDQFPFVRIKRVK